MMKNLFLILILFCSSSLLAQSNIEKSPQHTWLQDAEIIAFHTAKCGCCWGWEIKIGTLTIMTDKLPIDKPYDLFARGDKPIKVRIALGQQEKICKQYYEVLVIQKK